MHLPDFTHSITYFDTSGVSGRILSRMEGPNKHSEMDTVAYPNRNGEEWIPILVVNCT